MEIWSPDSSVVLELVPPTLKKGEEGIRRRLKRLEGRLEAYPFDAINIPEIREEASRSGGGSRTSGFEPRHEARALGRLIQERYDIPVVINHVVVHAPEAEFRIWLRQTRDEYGLENLILVGAPTDEEFPGPSVPVANAIAREELGKRGQIGNISIPGRETPAQEVERMEAKADSGADFFSTQIVYDAGEVTRLLDQLSIGPSRVADHPLLISLCPIRRPSSITFLRYLGVEISELLEQRLVGDGKGILERSIDHIACLWEEILEYRRERRPQWPIGWNIAPVGPLPQGATRRLLERLGEMIPGS
ncbi:MAG TPA: hypothetical protein EYN79_06010 [Planctomycetes bacterium]|nr:hypothetical protein [Planctomycetota bacterium]